MDKVTICPFTDCEEVARMNKDEAISGAVYGACTTDSSGTTQEALLEMHSHRYLPNEQVRTNIIIISTFSFISIFDITSDF
jgi:hypothetical protein